MQFNNNKRDGESGNVLFLILIAVALFAALSYAVTQSTRSGGGSTEREKAVLSSASMTQHPTAMRTAIIRMVLAGTDVADLAFDAPGAFAGISTDRLVFHPDGGGGVYQNAPADLMSGQGQGAWFYNANWDVPQIGTDGAGGNDIIAFLPGVTQAVCAQINEEFSIGVQTGGSACTSTDGIIPDLDAATTEANISDNFVDGDPFPVTDQEDIANANVNCTELTAQPTGCFYDSDNTEYVFYSVLLER